MSDRLKDNRRGYYRIDNIFLEKYGAKLGVYGIAAYNALARYANADGENAFPSYRRIADLTGMSERKAVEAIGQLVDMGLVLREKRSTDKGQTSNLYTLIDIPYAQDAPPPMHVVHTPYARGAYDQDTIKKTQLEEVEADACNGSASPTPSPTPTENTLLFPLQEKELLTNKRTTKTPTPQHSARPPSPRNPAAVALSAKNKELLKEFEPKARPIWPAIEKQINALAAGDNPMTPEEYEYVFRALKRDHWWAEKPLTPSIVGKQAGAILARVEDNQVTMELEYAW